MCVACVRARVSSRFSLLPANFFFLLLLLLPRRNRAAKRPGIMESAKADKNEVSFSTLGRANDVVSGIVLPIFSVSLFTILILLKSFDRMIYFAPGPTLKRGIDCVHVGGRYGPITDRRRGNRSRGTDGRDFAVRWHGCSWTYDRRLPWGHVGDESEIRRRLSCALETRISAFFLFFLPIFLWSLFILFNIFVIATPARCSNRGLSFAMPFGPTVVSRFLNEPQPSMMCKDISKKFKK